MLNFNAINNVATVTATGERQEIPLEIKPFVNNLLATMHELYSNQTEDNASLFNNKDVVLFARAFKVLEKFDNLEKIFKFFYFNSVTGDKARKYYSKEEASSAYPQRSIIDRKSLMTKLNKSLEKNEYSIESLIQNTDIIDELNDTDFDLFLDILLHNVGTTTEKKESHIDSASYLLSDINSDNKFLKPCSNDRIYDVFFIGALNGTNLNNYFLTDNLNKLLQHLGIQYFDDENHEILLRDGIHPAQLIGFLYAEHGNDNYSLILNPFVISSLETLVKSDSFKDMDVISNLLLKSVADLFIYINQTDFDIINEQELQRKGYFIDIPGQPHARVIETTNQQTSLPSFQNLNKFVQNISN